MFTSLVLESLDEPGKFEVLGNVYYHGSFDYCVPDGTVTDLASIPRPLRAVFSQTGLSRKPAVFHDHMYQVKWKTRKECDKAFKEMLIARGMTKFRAFMYYSGVRMGGWTRGSW
jgi:hypothetical protein